MIVGKERLALFAKYPLPPFFFARGFALNGNRFCGVLVGDHNVDAASVSERDGGNEAPSLRIKTCWLGLQVLPAGAKLQPHAPHRQMIHPQASHSTFTRLSK